MIIITNREVSVLIKERVQTNIFSIVIAIVAAVTLGVFFSSHASAQTSKTDSTNTMKVSPVRSDITVPAGTSKSVQVTLTNLTNAPITVTPVSNDFIAGDERGTPALILEADQYAPTHSLKRFMKPLPNLTVPPKTSRQVDVVITVPKDARAGGYFGALRFAPTSVDGSGNVNLSTSVASLILMTVPGNFAEKVTLTNFDIQQNGQTNSNFRSSNDLQLALRFKNEGDVQEGLFGQVSVKQGNKVVYTTNFNDQTPRDMILPDSARRWDIPLKNIGSFGEYTVIGTFTYGAKNETIDVTKTFWVIPWEVIIGTIAAVLILIGLIVGIWLFLRNYKRRILRNQRSGFRRR